MGRRFPAGPVDDYAYGYQIWNIYASKTIWRGIRAFGAINNLGNSRDPQLEWAEPTSDRPDYGRTFQIGLRYIFPHREL